MSEATPRPWTVNGFGGDFLTVARVGIGARVIVSAPSSLGDDIENARLIVRAVNSHDELLAVVRDFRQKLATYTSVYPGDKELRRQLEACDAVLAKASA